ncbi:hypothetical protein Q5P01_022282 [Channa striata]|uniref:Uncharacterized protein n=1 Tax=Channa striata TaxID=64152 RepID=A0AA88J8N1_CHASR|nr:hypothetical protein Q5P01_022282 [Channa striata]
MHTVLQREWDSLEQASCNDLVQDPDVRWAVKRLFSGTVLLPTLSCRPRPEDGFQSRTSQPRIKHSRSLGTLTSSIPRS